MTFIQKEKSKTFVDSFCPKKTKQMHFDLPMARFVQAHKNRTLLVSKNGRKRDFLAGQSYLYIGQEDLKKIRKGEKIPNFCYRIDSVHNRSFVFSRPPRRSLVYLVRTKDDVFEQIKDRYFDISNYIRDLFNGSVQGVTVTRMWNVSLVGALIFGMFLMTMIYRYLGQGAAARSKETASYSVQEDNKVLGESDVKNSAEADKLTEELLRDYQQKLKEGMEAGSMEKQIREMVKGYPIEKMAPYIAKKDKVVAAFLVGIAKKESDWGKHVPVLKGEDCYNYWGYRGKRDRMGTGGHTCFNSPQDAVDTVAKRLEFLVSSEKANTPEKMVVWKCGYDCSWDDPKAVKKWISDVDMYFARFNTGKK